MGLTLIIAVHRRRQDLALALRLAPPGLPEGTAVRYLRLPRLMEELGLAHGDAASPS